MNNNIELKVNEMKELNDITLKNEIAIFGSTYMKNFPFYEFVNKCKLENAVYNRSIQNLTLADALEALQVCVLDIKPCKIFLCLGEYEYDDVNAVSIYKKIIYEIRKKLPNSKIYVIELPTSGAENFNKKIREFCDGKNIINIKFSAYNASTIGIYKEQFKQLTCHFRNKTITLSDIFSVASI